MGPHASFRHSPDHIMWKHLPPEGPVLLIIVLVTWGRCPLSVYCMNQSLWPRAPSPRGLGPTPTPTYNASPCCSFPPNLGNQSRFSQTSQVGCITLGASPALAHNRDGGKKGTS